MKSKTILWFALLLILLSACAPNETSTPTAVGPAPQPTPTPSLATLVASLTAPTPTPTAVPVQGKVVLVASPDIVGAERVAAAQAALTELAATAKWALETRPAFGVQNLAPEIKVVVFLQPTGDLAALTSAAPQIQWVITGNEKLDGSNNVSIIRQREELRTFVAGYLTTLVASDWRAAGLVWDAQSQDAFVNGGRYWCGRCIPMYPPVVLFPLAVVQPAGSAAMTWQSAFNAVQKNVIYAAYISPAAYSPELAKSLFALKLTLVGTQPPPAEVKSRWAATLVFDPVPALRKLWPSLAAGKSGQADASLMWTDVNLDLFSEGKQRLVQETLGRLLDGTVGIFSVAP
jgi:hypothetical protein